MTVAAVQAGLTSFEIPQPQLATCHRPLTTDADTIDRMAELVRMSRRA